MGSGRGEEMGSVRGRTSRALDSAFIQRVLGSHGRFVGTRGGQCDLIWLSKPPSGCF